ncbi:MAG: hypothetical protein ACK4GL_03290 [Flavobacteriales bacterium]
MQSLDFHMSLPDGGPVYYETPHDHEHIWLVEPWNAISSLAYLIPVVYWFVKLKGDRSKFKFLLACLPLMLLGGIGSTLFHGLRSSPWLLYLDFVPIIILIAMLTYYFSYQLIENHLIVSFLLLFIFGLRIFVSQVFPNHTGINISYFIGGASLFLPAFILLRKTNFLAWNDLVLAAALFILALLFREMDRWDTQPLTMGTHFLWHLFSAAGGFFLGKYLFRFQFFRLRILKHQII